MRVNTVSCHRPDPVLRFTLGITLAIAISYGLNWTLSYVMPVFLAKFFADRPTPGAGTVKELLCAMTATVVIALVVSKGVTQYPVILLLLIALVMLWAYYLFQSPSWNFFAVILMIAILLIPYVGLVDPALPVLLGEGLMVSGVGAVAIYWLMYRLFPEPEQGETSPRVTMNSGPRLTIAVNALFISFPVIAYFYYFQISGALLTMAFIGILSLQLTRAGSKKLSQFLLLTNVIGGLLAVLAYELLVTVPWFPFMLALLALFAAVVSRRLYSEPDKAPLYAAIFSAMLVVLGSVLASGDKQMGISFYARIGQIALAGLYLVLAAGVVDRSAQG
ncbi:Protein of unknown function [Ferrimonas sediminum]|uniref:DUF2955 domain-containing protein n=1 Tax=Ferrimonas sediminum TaxID=718193 RepID=A0A1G8SHQ5_9GAMM|nr:DUF2955 domain-containing protein [Ferrimonas sediminum]SDJ28693.1 Protein of unknown function [Ferrimonas sediminum]